MSSTTTSLSPYSLDTHLHHLHSFLLDHDVQSLLRHHPNDVASNPAFAPPSRWREWWLSQNNDSFFLPTDIPALDIWIRVLRAYSSADHSLDPSIPEPIRKLVKRVRALQLPRSSVFIDGLLSTISDKGMSPKKAHEVSRMATYVVHLIRANSLDVSRLRIVDIGAGQGYLTRTLKAQLPTTRILALDADQVQTVGARRWEERVLSHDPAHPPIDHRTIFISPATLVNVISEWVSESIPSEEEPAPVLLVALHACGSLTPDIFRAFFSAVKYDSDRRWMAFGVLAVGCCYNLMNAGALTPALDLPISAYHLAAQVPAHWLSATDPTKLTIPVALSVRKVAWRALLAHILLQKHAALPNAEEPPTAAVLIPSSSSDNSKQHTVPARWSRLPQIPATETIDLGTGTSPLMRRLGRLRDPVYASWETFIKAAGEKMGVDLSFCATDRDLALEYRMEILHTLRCLLGPAIESAILLDRLKWIKEHLDNEPMKAKLVNLFDQSIGSARNVAIVVAPSIPP
ncbi:methyltransferase domain-containing protein, partial [Cyathus striatus]